MPDNPNGLFMGDTPSGCCWPGNGGFACNPRLPLGSSGVMGFPNVTAYAGGLPNCLDGQITYNMFPGLIVEITVGGFGSSWVVENLGPNQQTVRDWNGNYTIIRARDTAQTGLSFVLRE